MVEVAAEEEEEDDAEELCNCEFTLAYGTKILLHNTKMKLKRGYRYGLLGGNDCGKTTLMRSIANGMVEGFPSPDEVRTVFVEADILGELSHLNCADYVFEDPRIQSYGISKAQVAEILAKVGFDATGAPKQDDPITTLSGGWRMKLALARAMLQKADILLLDEPTNHLDVRNVRWVKDYLLGLKDVTAIMVSHDSGLLTDVCTHIIEISNLKLSLTKGNLSDFIKIRPEAKAYFEFKATKLKFHFPAPGPIEGVKSKGKALIKVSDVTFQYPRNQIPTIEKATVQVSLSSRVACVGPNGAGKSTLIKVLTGETEPTKGEVWRHPNARIGYIAQHAFHHIESHLNKTPNEYIRWRYAGGEDKEAIVKDTMVVTDAERELMDKPIEISVKNEETGKITKFKRVIQKLTGERRENKAKQLEYSVKWKGIDEGETLQWVAAKTLEKQSWGKHMKKVDMKINMMKGVYNRPLTQANVEKHLEDVGLDKEFGSHYRISALSGGQKVKVVLGGALWMQPHLIILDEPTNYLDRESLGALAGAIQEFDGGVVIISHNNDFCQMLCPETWVVEKDADGISRPNCKGDPEWMKHAMETKISDQQQVDEVVDAAGNVTKLKKKKDLKKLNKKEQKKMMEMVKNKISAGDDLDTDEEEFAQLYDL
jgi:elongation factor 3